MNDLPAILKKRLATLESHYQALEQYKALSDEIISHHSLIPEVYRVLSFGQRAIFEAYLKRFSAIQDYLGSKVFGLALEYRGIGARSMTEVLSHVEAEGIITLDSWIDLRNLRNELEHDYPEELNKALKDLQTALDAYGSLVAIIERLKVFVGARG